MRSTLVSRDGDSLIPRTLKSGMGMKLSQDLVLQSAPKNKISCSYIHNVYMYTFKSIEAWLNEKRDN